MQVHLLCTLLLPLLGALGMALLGQRRANAREAVTLVTAVGLAGLVWTLLPSVLHGGRPALPIAELLPGLAVEFRLEPIGMLFGALASLLWLVNSIYSFGYMRANAERHQTRFYVLFAVAMFATLGIAFAGNLLTLFLFYELLTLSTYPLVAHSGSRQAIISARVYLGILLGTSIGLFLPAMIWTYRATGTLDFMPGGILSGHVSGPAAGLLLALYVFGVGKAAVMPVHRWLPAAMVAPAPVSALLHAVAVVKAGVFTLTKVVVYIFGIDFLAGQSQAGWLLYAAAFTVIVASFVAFRQTNLKRLLAYSTIGQLSYVIMAVSLFRPLAELGAVVHMVAHALGKITLFFAAGSLYTAAGITEIGQLRGIGRRMPWTMLAFTVGALSMIGMPPTAGFVSKWFILSGALEADNYVAIAAIVASTMLNAAYFLPIVVAAWFDSATIPREGQGEAPVVMLMAVVATAAMTVLFFFANGTALDLMAQLFGGAHGS
ncbi:MAG TPA: proton-conducting transporter membrane subunit [Steroidobacteraceae bacterium]|nr:proton-conducting transporter membrane subunit [Steroidobacteraceae bacterium]HRX88693.1 proton-conducting transporter membrane subunit [Steroidobacteraceae bacterium]